MSLRPAKSKEQSALNSVSLHFICRSAEVGETLAGHLTQTMKSKD
jgi:hypothetical protein